MAEMQIDTNPEFADAAWQPFEDRISLAPEKLFGDTVHLRVRDGAGNVSGDVAVYVGRQQFIYLPLVQNRAGP